MSRRALCVGGPPALHGDLEAAYAAADVRFRAIRGPLLGDDLQAFRVAEPDADILVWAVYEPNEAHFETLTSGAVREYLDRTIFSFFSTLQTCLVGMERRRYGRILALSNLSGRLGDEDLLASTVSGAVEGLIRSVARETARKGVTANVLQLGQIEGWDAVGARISRAFYDVFYTFREPFRVHDLAKTIAELTTSEAGKLNGQIIGFDGGTAL
jgi:NAD(P)-dependent dehydrogenase (short-subunit alcohol dehydrogenase family)